MASSRRINKVITGRPGIDGAGVHLTRVFGNQDTADFDPFLLLDAFDSVNPDDYTRGFPWHPHRGIETITYLIEGEIGHADSLGNKGVINAGDSQWMTAGSGIIHQEMPQASPRLMGAQLWLNLPQSAKMTPPAYGDIRTKDIPVVQHNDAVIRIIAGTYQGKSGAFAPKHVPATYLDVSMSPHSTWEFETKMTDRAFAYILSGAGVFESDGSSIPEKHAVLWQDGPSVTISTTDTPIRFLFLVAPPLHEPIAWGGPIVMNTKTELDTAFAELNQGTFIRK